MNLQVCAPHQECVYNCSFCVARGHKHKYQFKDIYIGLVICSWKTI